MKIKIKKLHENAVIPFHAKDGDAGMDLTVTTMEYDGIANVMKYNFGIAVQIPKGYVGLVFPRSSIYKTGMKMTNSVGVIDSGYRGEISAVMTQNSVHNIYRPGDRAAQLVIIKHETVQFEEVNELEGSERGEGGYGSTGK